MFDMDDFFVTYVEFSFITNLDPVPSLGSVRRLGNAFSCDVTATSDCSWDIIFEILSDYSRNRVN